MIVIAGSRIAFSGDHSLDKLRTLAGLILTVWIMLTLYTRPSPLLGGYSFSEVIPRTAFSMADLVGNTTQQQMWARLSEISAGIGGMVPDHCVFRVVATAFSALANVMSLTAVDCARIALASSSVKGLRLRSSRLLGPKPVERWNA